MVIDQLDFPGAKEQLSSFALLDPKFEPIPWPGATQPWDVQMMALPKRNGELPSTSDGLPNRFA